MPSAGLRWLYWSYHATACAESNLTNLPPPMPGSPRLRNLPRVALLIFKCAQSSFGVSKAIQKASSRECVCIGKNTEFGVGVHVASVGPLNPNTGVGGAPIQFIVEADVRFFLFDRSSDASSLLKKKDPPNLCCNHCCN